MNLLFILFAFVVWTILFLVHSLVYTTLSRVYSYTLPHASIVLGLLSISYLVASIGVRTMSRFATEKFYFITSTWLGIIFLVFCGVLLYGIYHVATGADSKILLGILLSSALLLSLYALFQGSVLTTNTQTVPLSTLQTPLRIVHVSDIHVGTVHRKKYLERIVEKTNALQPDIVLITGDLFDGSARIEPDMLTPLNDLTAKTFFTHGNHETYEGLTYVRETLANINLELLENNAVEYKGVHIVGVNDRTSLPHGENLSSILSTLALDAHTPQILMYHTPVEWDIAKEHGVSLMLSGHTHNGQIFPFTLLVRLFFSHIQGLYEDNGKYLHVSSGTGTWGPPMRLGSRNQITLLLLEPTE